jgi:hypothetical protein
VAGGLRFDIELMSRVTLGSEDSIVVGAQDAGRCGTSAGPAPDFRDFSWLPRKQLAVSGRIPSLLHKRSDSLATDVRGTCTPSPLIRGRLAGTGRPTDPCRR